MFISVIRNHGSETGGFVGTFLAVIALNGEPINMLTHDEEELRRLAGQNFALIALLEKVHRMLKPYKGEATFNGELFKVIDVELFKAKNFHPLENSPRIKVVIKPESRSAQPAKNSRARVSA